jgi:hypothetical protein
MKFPSINQLYNSFLNVCKRFPFPILYAIIATICALTLTDKDTPNQFVKYYVKGIYLGNFGLALSLALALYSEINLLNKMKYYFFNGVVILVLALIYYVIDPYLYDSDIILLLILGFAFHLLVAFSAFTSKQENNGFWQINKNFFLQFATSALYSVVLFIGLSIAILSTDKLFSLKFSEQTYIRLWVCIVGVFNTIFFLSGVSQPLKNLETETAYPKRLKVFTQYILIPLATIYLSILLAYEVKIIIQWSLPQSSVAILILGYAVFGILSILLVHPIRNQEGNKWINLFSKSFYLLMLPLLILLAASIYKRVVDYGITESRYLLIVMAIWLTFISIYFLINGRKQIRLIPISLFILSILIVIGPWGIKAVSKRSQQNRLEKILANKSVNKKNNDAYSIVNYLADYHGIKSLQQFVKPNLSNIEEKLSAEMNKANWSKWDVNRKLKDTVISLMKINPNFKVEVDSQSFNYYNFTTKDKSIDLENAVKLIPINGNDYYQDSVSNFLIDNKNYKLSITPKKLIRISSSKSSIILDTDSLLNALISNNKIRPKSDNGTFQISNKEMTISKNLEGLIFTFYISTLNGNKGNINYNGNIIVKKNDNF